MVCMPFYGGSGVVDYRRHFCSSEWEGIDNSTGLPNNHCSKPESWLGKTWRVQDRTKGHTHDEKVPASQFRVRRNHGVIIRTPELNPTPGNGNFKYANLYYPSHGENQPIRLPSLPGGRRIASLTPWTSRTNVDWADLSTLKLRGTCVVADDGSVCGSPALLMAPLPSPARQAALTHPAPVWMPFLHADCHPLSHFSFRSSSFHNSLCIGISPSGVVHEII